MSTLGNYYQSGFGVSSTGQSLSQSSQTFFDPLTNRHISMNEYIYRREMEAKMLQAAMHARTSIQWWPVAITTKPTLNKKLLLTRRV